MSGTERVRGTAQVRLSGLLVCASAGEAELVQRYLPGHTALTRSGPACLSFEVRPTSDPLVWQVVELFADEAGFAGHQERAAASEWGRATAHIERRYTVELAERR
ncbi:putative quinol monooxygenase [Georgenia sp. Z1491]|uniref:putative quinol monooxygenase n=1 Tax=Georgenia sp. Z1491 TaxID=3416707 RepID=UPI003CE77EF7